MLAPQSVESPKRCRALPRRSRERREVIFSRRVVYELQGAIETAAKEAGKMRLEGKEYVVTDGDVMHFRFNR